MLMLMVIAAMHAVHCCIDPRVIEPISWEQVVNSFQINAGDSVTRS